MNNMKILAVAMTLALGSTAALAQAQQVAAAPAKPRMMLDTNKDGMIDRAEAAKMPGLAARFDQLDKNRDGKLGADERPHMKGKRHGGAMRGGHSRMMALDTDKDGRISRAEAMSGKAGMGARFEQMDVNKDGYVDRADMQARMAKQRAEFFAGADANRDGRVTRNEFIVEQGARGAERQAKWSTREQAAGKQVPARKMPTEQQKIERAGKAFDAMDANKDGGLTRAEFDAFKPRAGGMRPGMGHPMGHGMAPAPKR